MSEINSVLKQITKKVNLETNLSKYSNYMMSMYNGFSYTKVALNYYTLCDLIQERTSKEDKIVELMSRLNVLVDKYVINQSVEDIESGVKEIDSIRRKVMETMSVLTSYADHFNIYEYILNRIEYKFSDEEYDDTYYKNELGKDIMNYIVSERENNTINLKISEMVGQLPVRMTKSKFLEHLSDTFTLYKGATVKTVDDFIYMIRTSATILRPEGFENELPELYDILMQFENEDFTKDDEQMYAKNRDLLTIAAEKVYALSDLYMIFEEVVNDVYAIILSNAYAINEVEKIDAAKTILKYAYNGYNKIESELTENDVDIAFDKLEGEQERISEIIMSSEYVLDDVINDSMDMCRSLMLDKIYATLKVISQLQSTSIFIELDTDNGAEDIIDENVLMKKRDELIDEFAVFLTGKTKQFNRAVMSVVLSSLPVFFNSLNEVTEYVENSLFGCSDEAEKRAVEEIIKNMIFE